MNNSDTGNGNFQCHLQNAAINMLDGEDWFYYSGTVARPEQQLIRISCADVTKSNFNKSPTNFCLKSKT